MRKHFHRKRDSANSPSGSGRRLLPFRGLGSLLPGIRGSESRNLHETGGNDGSDGAPSTQASTILQVPSTTEDVSPAGLLSAEEHDISLEMWNEAYEKVRERNKAMVDIYEKIIVTDPTATNARAQLAASTASIFVNLDARTRMAKMKAVATNAIDRFDGHAQLRENAVIGMSVVKEIANFVKDFLSFCPPAAFALSGVSAILPILSRPLEADQEMADSLLFVMDSLEWYMALCRLTLRNSSNDGMGDEQFRTCKDVLRSRIISLYVSLQELLMKCACRCYHDALLIRVAKECLGTTKWKYERELIQARTEGINSELVIFGLERSVKSLENIASNSRNTLLTAGRLETLLRDTRNSVMRSEKAKQEKYQSVLTGRFMTSPDYKKQLNLNNVRVENTCEWFCSHDKFNQWLSGTDSDLLLVSAIPGSGKSVLASYLIQDVIPKRRPDVTVCYYFFKDNAEESRLSNAYSALLHCLFTMNGKLADDCKTIIEQSGMNVREHENSLWSIFCEATSRIDSGPVICVLDALDECSEDGIATLGSDLLDLYNKLKSLQQRTGSEDGPSIKFLLTTRGYPSILRKFQNLHTSYMYLSGEGEKEINAIQKEIGLVVEEKLNTLAIERCLTSDQKNLLRTRLAKHGKGQKTYLWVKLIFEVLTSAYPQNNDKWVSFVDNLPDTVSEAYTRLLTRVPLADQKSALDLLSLVLVAYRPLSLQELNIAINVKNHPGKSSLADLHMTTDTHFRNWIINTCGFFVTEYGGKIYFIHQTARDFLLGQSDKHPGQNLTASIEFLGSKEDFLVNAHRTMAESCISYLSLRACKVGEIRKAMGEFVKEMRKGSEDLPQEAWAQIASHTFADYVLCFWPSHLRHGQSSGDGVLSSDIQEAYVPHYLSLIQDFEAKSHPGILVTLRAQDIATLWNDLGTDSRYINEPAPYERCALSLIKRLNRTSSLDAGLCLPNDMTVLAALWGHLRILRDRVGTREIEVGGPGPTHLNLPENKRLRGDSNLLLRHAVIGKSIPCLEHLLKHGVSPNEKNDLGQTAMHLASSDCSSNVIACLLKYGAAVDILDNDGQTPLFIVLRNPNPREREAAARLLVSSDNVNKLDFSTTDRAGNTALHLAAMANWEHGVDSDEHKQSHPGAPNPYSKEAQGGGFLGYLVDNGAYINAKNCDGETPLVVACREVKTSNVTKLLQSGANPDMADHEGYGPLHHCIEQLNTANDMSSDTRGLEGIVSALLEHGADPNRESHRLDRAHPLVSACVAARYYTADAVKLLLDHGADPHTRLRQGMTVLQHIMGRRYYDRRDECVLHFLRKGEDPNGLLEEGGSLRYIHQACFLVEPFLIRRLIDYNADINARDSQGRTPLHVLFSSDRRGRATGLWTYEIDKPWFEKTIRLLIWKGASITMRDNEGRTAVDLIRDQPRWRWLKTAIPELFDGNVDGLREPRQNNLTASCCSPPDPPCEFGAT